MSSTSTSSSSKYKLIYVNTRGFAETCRLLFKAAGQEFEDYRYPFTFADDGKHLSPEWDADKHKYLNEKIPVLEVDGVTISQSKAIERFLAKRFGMVGDNDLEAAQIDAAGEQLIDLKQAYMKAKEQKNKDNGEQLKTFFQDTLTKSFQAFNKQAEKNTSNRGYFIGKKLSLFDIQLMEFAHFFDDQESVQKALEPCKALKEIINNVENNKNIKKWIEERPKTRV
ncbi:unnamed protein product [Didymodactylos carnosus]|uniref:Glutathione S-transferase n=2 Tax=Didymodactylos carnosus TaxID=1234261 RepID=A0A815VFK6_9BILA|nr:unnamed protein product [Didymodactylos carnosus]CAF4391015.1 unnamed protein product [Didymodactylos carnosus]